jgi:putative transcriptional regulator
MDWLFEIDNNICDLRVAGILIKNNKIVVQRDKNGSEYAIPGGHVKIGETTEEAILYNEGKIKARTNTMSIEPVPDFKATEIKSIRNELEMTQVLFAGFMDVSPKTVEAWEAGRNMPDGPARRILAMLKVDPALPQRLNIIAK